MEQKGIFQDVPVAERRQYLLDNAYGVEQNETYMKPLNQEELESFQSDLVELTMAVQKDKEELKDVSKTYKDRIKENQKDIVKAAQAIRYGSIEVTGETFLMDNQEDGLMEIYSVDGMLINKRPLKKEERQLSLRSYKTGTNN